MMKRILSILMALLLPCAGIAEEIYPECEFDIEAYGGLLQVIYTDGGIEETGGWGFCTEITDEGTTIGDVLARFDIADVEIVGIDDVFEGWLAFDVSIVADEYGFDEYSYNLASETPISTEEMLALPVSENYTVYAAKWESIPAEDYFQYEEDTAETISMAAATLYANGGAFLMDGNDEDYESGLNVASIEPGQLLGEALELDRLLRISREGYAFSGWTMYQVGWMETFEEKPEDDGNPCFQLAEDWYCVLYDSSIIGEDMDTLALGEYVCDESELFIIATWE